MTQYPVQRILRLLPATALLATTLAASAPAHAAQDPEPSQAAAKKDFQTLDRAARSRVWCVEHKAAKGAKKTRECKTREAWIREGNDPLREF
jgi:Ni/Co efflux regulator RcnB